VAVEQSSAETVREAARQNDAGLKLYSAWEIDDAIKAFMEAAARDPNNPDYHLNLARAYARAGNYPESMKSLGNYLHVETDEYLTDRYERLFSSALDEVEASLIEGMSGMDLPVQITGKAMQMWLEYRLTVGRQPIEQMDQPELWAASLTYLACKINFEETSRIEVGAIYDVDLLEMKNKCNVLIETLDLITADYRYFTGDENPLDEVFEAAQKMDELVRGLNAED
jgi:tetratricopeptide (TPR) repeat protein